MECITKSNRYFIKLETSEDLDFYRIQPFSVWLFFQMISGSLSLMRMLAIFQGLLLLIEKKWQFREKSLKCTFTLD